MTYNSQIHHRRSIRLRGYDYSQVGAYFVTVCAQDRECLFGEVAGDQMHLNDAGRMVLAEWDRLMVRFPTAELDAFVVMPNHIHGIVVISFAETRSDGLVGAGLVPAPWITQTAADVPGPGATTRVAPTRAGDDFGTGTGGDVTTGDPNNGPSFNVRAGTGLVPAQDGTTGVAAGTILGAEQGATTRVAPTNTADDYVAGIAPGNAMVGAGLVPAPGITTGPDDGTTRTGATTRRATTRVAPTPNGDHGGTRADDDFRTGTGGDPNPSIDVLVGAGLVPAPGTTEPILGDIVGAFKSLTTDSYILGVKQSGWPGFRRRLWQRNYYEHIIRSDESLNRIRRYILENPARWATDPENPQAERKKETA